MRELALKNLNPTAGLEHKANLPKGPYGIENNSNHRHKALSQNVKLATQSLCYRNFTSKSKLQQLGFCNFIIIYKKQYYNTKILFAGVGNEPSSRVELSSIRVTSYLMSSRIISSKLLKSNRVFFYHQSSPTHSIARVRFPVIFLIIAIDSLNIVCMVY